MKAYLIQPKLRTITEVEYDGSIEGIAKLYPYNPLMVDMSRFTKASIDGLAHLPQSITQFLSEKVAEEDGAFSFVCDDAGCGQAIHTIIGKALMIGRREIDKVNYEPCDPHMTLEEARKWIKWARVEKMTLGQMMERLMNGEIRQAMTLDTGEVFDAKSIVKAELEMARVSTKH